MAGDCWAPRWAAGRIGHCAPSIGWHSQLSRCGDHACRPKCFRSARPTAPSLLQAGPPKPQVSPEENAGLSSVGRPCGDRARASGGRSALAHHHMSAPEENAGLGLLSSSGSEPAPDSQTRPFTGVWCLPERQALASRAGWGTALAHSRVSMQKDARAFTRHAPSLRLGGWHLGTCVPGPCLPAHMAHGYTHGTAESQHGRGRRERNTFQQLSRSVHVSCHTKLGHVTS